MEDELCNRMQHTKINSGRKYVDTEIIQQNTRMINDNYFKDLINESDRD